MEAITLRPAIFSDAEMVFEWRNAPETRRYFFDSSPLNKLDHISWFEQSLGMPSRCLLIAENNQKAIGVLRYDFSETRAEIDIYLAPEFSGKGFGAKLLLAGTDWVRLHLPVIKTLQARVLPNNIASTRAFEKAGFDLKVQVYELDVR